MRDRLIQYLEEYILVEVKKKDCYFVIYRHNGDSKEPNLKSQEDEILSLSVMESIRNE